MRYVKQIYLATIFLFLYAPIAVLIAQSFNASRYRGHWTDAPLSNTPSIGLRGKEGV